MQATTNYQTYPERPPGADLPPKKVCNLDPMAARSLYICVCVCIYMHIVYMYTGLGGWLLKTDLSD